MCDFCLIYPFFEFEVLKLQFHITTPLQPPFLLASAQGMREAGVVWFTSLQKRPGHGNEHY
jgi:hypothetical protein